MILWEKKSLFESFNKVIFVDSFGYGTMPELTLKDFKFVINDKTYQVNELFVKKDDGYVRADSEPDKFFDHLSSQSLYLCTSYIDKTYELAKISKVSFSTFLRAIKNVKEVTSKKNELDLKAFNLELNFKEFLEYTLWVNKGELKNSFLQPGYREINFEDEFFILGEGPVKVIKTYLSDNKDDSLCDVSLEDGKVKHIKYGDATFVTTPIKFNEIVEIACSKFSKANNENIFQLHVEEVESRSKTLFYQPVKGADSYKVKVSRLVRNKLGFHYYHLKDYKLDNSTNCFYIPSEDYLQFGNNLFVRLIALDKNNNELASTSEMEF